MTIDELLQQLMKIKEIYPDSGKFQIVVDDADTNWYLLIKKEDIQIEDKKLVIRTDYHNKV